MPSVVLANVVTVNFLPTSGILDTIFHQTWLAINILGWPGGNGYKLTLIGLILVLIIAAAATATAERLAGAKPGGMLLAVLITLFGAWLFSAYVLLPFDIVMEGVRLVAALLGAIVVSVFYVLLLKQISGGSKR
jgi:spore maturation protein SpmB